MMTTKGFRADKRGASAIEFALVAPVFIALLLFLMIAALIVYMNLALDYATTKAARVVMIGTAQKSSMSQTAFRTQVVCPVLPAAMRCDDVIVNLYQLTESYGAGGYTDYVNLGAGTLNVPALSNGAASYALGSQGAYQYLEIVYPVTFLPGLLAKVLGGTNYNGKPAYLTVATAAFKNEQY